MANELWTEKYRPRSKEEFEGPEHLKMFLQSTSENVFPHLLLFGPPGTGKTTFSLLLNPTLVLNASNDRGIDIIRNRIKKIANRKLEQVIVLDECENLTKDSQTCLRRILEDYPNTRFVFCTNYYEKIIRPIRSRLLKLKFTGGGYERLSHIGKKEGFPCDDYFYKKLYAEAQCDLRRATNVLQGMKPLLESGCDLKSQCRFLSEFLGSIPEEFIENFRDTERSNYKKYIRDFMYEGYSVLEFVRNLSRNLWGSSIQKSKFSMVLCELERLCVEGCSDELVLLKLLHEKLEIY